MLLSSLAVHTQDPGSSYNKGNRKYDDVEQLEKHNINDLFYSCHYYCPRKVFKQEKDVQIMVAVSLLAFSIRVNDEAHSSSPFSLCLCRVSPQWHSNRTRHFIRARGHPQGGHQLRPMQDHLRHLWLRQQRHFLLRPRGGALSLPDSQTRTGNKHSVHLLHVLEKPRTCHTHNECDTSS